MKKSFQWLAASMMTLSPLIAASAPKLPIMWVSMELGILGFICFLNTQSHFFSADSGLKYFIPQSIGSLMIFMSIMGTPLAQKSFEILILTALMLKMGAFPLHLWMVNMAHKIHWNSLFILLTLQKVTPLIFMSNFPHFFIKVVSSAGALFAAASTLSLKNIKKFFIYSSVFNLSWMMVCSHSLPLCLLFWVAYSISLAPFILFLLFSKSHLISHLFNSAQSILDKWTLFILTLNMAGLPPMTMFFIKMWAISFILKTSLLWVSLLLIFSSTIMFYVYFRLAVSTLNLPASLSPKPSFFPLLLPIAVGISSWLALMALLYMQI